MKNRPHSSKTKYMMHTPLNILSFFVIPLMLAVFGYLILRDAYNDTARILGIVAIFGIFIFASWLFIAKFRIFDWLEFSDDGVVRRSILGGRLTYSYSELRACVGVYTSVLEQKTRLIFTPKNMDGYVCHIDTSKFGNVIGVNRIGAVYCAAEPVLLEFLSTRWALELVGNREQ